ncbi:MAG: hypothetical protein V1894_06485 [Chloroflexota bacterium]
MLKNFSRGLAAFLAGILLVVIFAVPVLAFDARGGDTVTVPGGEVVEGDLYLAGGNIIVDGTVNGDIFGVGQSLTINGVVNGGVTFAGQLVTVNGEISNSARLAGQSITVTGKIGRDLVVAGSAVTINSQSVTSGDLVLAVGTALVNGRVGGNIRGGAGTVTVAGAVGGDVDLRTENLTITSGVSIQGNLTYTSQNEAVIQSGATIAGTTNHKMPEAKAPARRFPPVAAGAKVLWQVLCFLMTLIAGVILILIASPRLNLMANSIQSKPWQSLGWGAILLIVVPVASVIVMITVIGLPLGLISLVLYGIAVYLSQIPVGLLIGRLIIRQNRELGSRGLVIGALALGLLILLLLRLLPFIGWITGLLTVVFGLGTLVTSRRTGVTG